jgi:hypothetical protein
MNRGAGAMRRHGRRWWTAAPLMLGALLPAYGDGWSVRAVPDPEGGRSRCMLESARQVVDDGYTTTPVWVRIDARILQVATESDIDLNFHDVGLRVDDGARLPADAAQARQSVVFRHHVPQYLEALRHGQRLYVDLRFWPTWPTRGRRTVTLELDGFAEAFERLAAGC